MARFHITVAVGSNALKVADAHTSSVGGVVSIADQLAVIAVPDDDADYIETELDGDERVANYRRYDA